MWISRKRWEELTDRIKELEDAAFYHQDTGDKEHWVDGFIGMEWSAPIFEEIPVKEVLNQVIEHLDLTIEHKKQESSLKLVKKIYGGGANHDSSSKTED